MRHLLVLGGLLASVVSTSNVAYSQELQPCPIAECGTAQTHMLSEWTRSDGSHTMLMTVDDSPRAVCYYLFDSIAGPLSSLQCVKP